MKYKLKDIFDLQMGKTPSRNNIEYWNTKDFKWISISDLTKAHGYISETKEYISERAVSESGIKIIPANTVVMSFKLSIGKTAITSEDMYSNEAIMAFHDKHVVEILPEYIFYIFKYKKWDEDSNNAVMGKTLNKAILSEAEIEICSIEEQRAIVDILDNMMSVLESRGTELDLLDNLIKARFVEMFGDTRKNPYNYMKLTVAEAIEAGYIEKPFDGNHGGKHPKSSEYVECGTPFLMANNIVDGKVDLVNCSFITEERANKLDKGFARDNDVLITHKGTIGRTAVLRTDYDFVMLTPQVASYRVKDGLTSDYLCGYFNTDYFQNDMKTLASAGGSTRAYAGITAQLQLKLIIPPIDLQNQFVAFVHQVDKSKLLSLIKLLEQLITYLYNVFIIYRQDKGEEVERHE